MPGGTAVLPSSTLMLAVPAGIAGCKTIVMATPPRPDGSITPEVLYCAKKAGVTHILKAGGAQAVAAMAWGTETCPKVTGFISAWSCSRQSPSEPIYSAIHLSSLWSSIAFKEKPSKQCELRFRFASCSHDSEELLMTWPSLDLTITCVSCAKTLL